MAKPPSSRRRFIAEAFGPKYRGPILKGLLIIIILIALTVASLWSLALYVKAIETRTAGLLLCLALLGPVLLAEICRRTGLPMKIRAYLKPEDGKENRFITIAKGIPFLPVVAVGMLWAWFVYELFGREEGRAWNEWAETHLGLIYFSVLSPSAIFAFYLISIGSLKFGTYLAISIIVLSITGPLAGLSIEKGILTFFGGQKGSASPSYVLGCALMFALGFSCLHYELAIIDPAQYTNLHGWQDAIYFSVITMATVGYGDISPAQHLARWLSTAEVVGGFCLLVVAVNASMTVWIQSHQPKDSDETLPKSS